MVGMRAIFIAQQLGKTGDFNDLFDHLQARIEFIILDIPARSILLLYHRS